MKKKVFSKLLMVALVATVGVFSSCKDYDDDISDVNGRITQTATELRNDYNAKIDAASKSIATLQTLYNGLDEAYKKADAQLNSLIMDQTAAAVKDAKAYSDANLATAKEAAKAAEEAAKEAAQGYAKVEAAAAQTAAIAAAKEAVAEAQKTLSAALAEANTIIAQQGESITNLIEAKNKLDAALVAAQARADQAYALAEKANTLAETNKANLEKAAADIAALQTGLANLQGTAANKADVAKLQSDLAALKGTVDNNVVDLASYKESITSITSELAKLNSDLATAISNLNESIAAVKSTADGNVAAIDALKTQLTTIDAAWQLADQEIIKSINSLAATVDANKTDAAANLKSAVDAITAELAAKQTLIENNDAAIKALLNTKVSELNKLIEGNAASILAANKTIADNKAAQDAANTVMQNDIAKNAKDIVAQGKDITNLDDAIKAIKKALGDDTAETLKAYAKSIAESNALQAKLDAQGYADAQDAAQKLTLMQAIKDQADQDAKAWTAAINLAIENLVTTYKLASLNEYIKTTAEAAQTAAEKNAAVKAQEIANKALADAKAYTDVLAQTLKDNYTPSTDMKAAIETAKKAAISQAYLDVLNTLLRDYDEWYNMNDENKMNLELTPTIIELTKAAVEKYGLTKENAQSIIDATIEAGLAKPEGTGTYDKDGKEIMTPAGVIMAEILAAADALQQELDAVDLRVADIEKILGATVANGDTTLTGKIFTASVNALIATATDDQFAALKEQLAGTKASGLLTQIEAAAAQANQNAIDLKAIDAAIANLNTKFTGLTPASEDVKSNLTEENFKVFGENIDKLIARVNKNSNVIDNLGNTVEKYVNKFLAEKVGTMITSIHLFANQHQHDDDSYNETMGGYTTDYANAWDGFNHSLVFTYAIEKGTTFPWADMQKYVDDKLTFTNGFVHTYPDSILVRVNPVNAELDPSQIALINSKGEDVIDKGIVKVVSVERYDRDFYITRGSNDGETGLWVIKFKLVEEKPDVWSEFKAAAFTKNPYATTVVGQGRYSNEVQILYAVGVKNTNFSEDPEAEDDGMNRYVVSEYDLDLNTQKAYHIWNYDVNGQTVATIHNRYIVNENKPNSTLAAKLWTADKKEYPESYYEELTFAPYDSVAYMTYAGSNDYPKTPSECYMTDTAQRYNWYINNQYPIGNYIKTKSDGSYYVDEFGERVIVDYPAYIYEDLKPFKEGDEAGTFNVIDRYHNFYKYQSGYMTNGVDNRDYFDIKTIFFDANDEWADIEIEFPNPICNGHSTEIGGFFVMLDQNFARESSTSEVSAWTQYIYKNVGFFSVNGFNTKTGEFILDPSREDTQAGIKDGIRKAHLFKGNKGTISIKNARGAKGDVIGFRVYAVNLDGTLYDPDGRAFYVKVGDPNLERTLNFEVTAYKQRGDSALQKKDLEYGDAKNISLSEYNDKAAEKEDANFFNISKVEINKGAKYFYEWSWAEGNPVVRTDHASTSTYAPVADATNYLTDLFDFTYSEEKDDKVKMDDNAQWHRGFYPGGQWDKNVPGYRDINNVKVTLKDAARLQNDSTYHLKCVVTKEDVDGATNVVNVVYVNVTKKMPQGLPEAFGVRLTQENNVKNVAFYLRPVNGYSNGINYNGSTANNVWDIDPYFFNENHKTYEKYGESAIDDLTRNAYSYRPLRWAVDVRPYNFEEFFTGLFLDAEDKVIDPDYNFVFEGAGGYKYNESTNKEEEWRAADAISVYRPKMIIYSYYQPIYSGLDNAKRLQTSMQPTYYLPFVNYKMIEKYPSNSKKLAVKAGYTYHDINFTIDKQTGAVSDVNYQIEPVYFDKDGNTVEKAADAAFQCYFKCAIDETFTGKFYLATDTSTVEMRALKPNAYKDLKGVGASAAKPVPYGTKFQVFVDSLNLKWRSNLAILPYDATTEAEAAKYFGASYFMTAFDKFTTKYTKVDAAGKSYYVDTLAVTTDQGFDNRLYRINEGEVSGTAVKYLKLVDVADPYITKVLITKPGKAENATGADAPTELSEAKGNLDRIYDYFDIKDLSAEEGVDGLTYGEMGVYGLVFIPKTTVLDPTKIGQFVIFVKNNAKAVHQWGHTAGFNSDNVKIYIGNPNSTPNINSSRRAR